MPPPIIAPSGPPVKPPIVIPSANDSPRANPPAPKVNPVPRVIPLLFKTFSAYSLKYKFKAFYKKKNLKFVIKIFIYL